MSLAAIVARDWYSRRPLRDDAEWGSQAIAAPLWATSAPTAPRLKARLPALRKAADVLRDTHRELSGAFDEAVSNNEAVGWTPEQAAYLVVTETITASRLAFAPSMDEASRRRRLAEIPDAVFTLGEDADLFAYDTLAGISGMALMQATVLGLRFAEVCVRNLDGQVARRPGRRSLSLERAAAKTITDYFQQECGRALYPHAGVLLIAACPSQALRGWQTDALRVASVAVPVRKRKAMRGRTPRDLPDDAYLQYSERLGKRVKTLLGGKKPR